MMTFPIAISICIVLLVAYSMFRPYLIPAPESLFEEGYHQDADSGKVSLAGLDDFVDELEDLELQRLSGVVGEEDFDRAKKDLIRDVDILESQDSKRRS